jgi:hypothetical protein
MARQEEVPPSISWADAPFVCVIGTTIHPMPRNASPPLNSGDPSPIFLQLPPLRRTTAPCIVPLNGGRTAPDSPQEAPVIQPLKYSEPLPEDWSPAGLWEAAGLDSTLQRGIDEFQLGDARSLHSECRPVDESTADDAIRAALDAEKTLSKAARRRILEALELE